LAGLPEKCNKNGFFQLFEISREGREKKNEHARLADENRTKKFVYKSGVSYRQKSKFLWLPILQNY
jgi:hypothetical protein